MTPAIWAILSVIAASLLGALGWAGWYTRFGSNKRGLKLKADRDYKKLQGHLIACRQRAAEHVATERQLVSELEKSGSDVAELTEHLNSQQQLLKQVREELTAAEGAVLQAHIEREVLKARNSAGKATARTKKLTQQTVVNPTTMEKMEQRIAERETQAAAIKHAPRSSEAQKEIERFSRMLQRSSEMDNKPKGESLKNLVKSVIARVDPSIERAFERLSAQLEDARRLQEHAREIETFMENEVRKAQESACELQEKETLERLGKPDLSIAHIEQRKQHYEESVVDLQSGYHKVNKTNTFGRVWFGQMEAAVTRLFVLKALLGVFATQEEKMGFAEITVALYEQLNKQFDGTTDQDNKLESLRRRLEELEVRILKLFGHPLLEGSQLELSDLSRRVEEAQSLLINQVENTEQSIGDKKQILASATQDDQKLLRWESSEAIEQSQSVLAITHDGLQALAKLRESLRVKLTREYGAT